MGALRTVVLVDRWPPADRAAPAVVGHPVVTLLDDLRALGVEPEVLAGERWPGQPAGGQAGADAWWRARAGEVDVVVAAGPAALRGHGAPIETWQPGAARFALCDALGATLPGVTPRPWPSWPALPLPVVPAVIGRPGPPPSGPAVLLLGGGTDPGGDDDAAVSWWRELTTRCEQLGVPGPVPVAVEPGRGARTRWAGVVRWVSRADLPAVVFGASALVLAGHVDGVVARDVALAGLAWEVPVIVGPALGERIGRAVGGQPERLRAVGSAAAAAAALAALARRSSGGELEPPGVLARARRRHRQVVASLVGEAAVRRSPALVRAPASIRADELPPVAPHAGLRLDDRVGPPVRVRRPLRPGHLPAAALRDGCDAGAQFASWWAAHPFDDTARTRLRQELNAAPDRPRISVLLPVHDTDPALLRAALRSVFDQVEDRWELCVVDDGSTAPATRAVLDELPDDPRIRFARREAGGIVAATMAAWQMATGDVVTFLDHDDELTPDALAAVSLCFHAEPDLDVVTTDEMIVGSDGAELAVFCKPTWSPELLTCVNYAAHLVAIRATTFAAVGGLREGFDGSQDHDLLLRLVDRGCRAAHLPVPVYRWRAAAGSTAADPDAKPYAARAARRALAEHAQRVGFAATIEAGLVPGTHRIRWAVEGGPRVSVIVPTRDGGDRLERCLSALRTTAGRPIELVLVDNGSRSDRTAALLQREAWRGATVVRHDHPFHFSHLVNRGAEAATGEYLLLLNDDVVFAGHGWLDAMLEHAQRPDIGAVGARLLFPDGRTQHDGITLGPGDAVGIRNMAWNGYYGLDGFVRDVQAATGACLLVRAATFWALGGFPGDLPSDHNDVDFCLRLRHHGYRVVVTPYATAWHDEGATRGRAVGAGPSEPLVTRWGDPRTLLDGFVNPNLRPDRPDRLFVG